MMFSGPRLVGIIYKHQQQKFPVIKKEGEKEIIARAEKRERRRRRSRLRMEEAIMHLLKELADWDDRHGTRKYRERSQHDTLSNK